MKILEQLLERGSVEPGSLKEQKRFLRQWLKTERARLKSEAPGRCWGPLQAKATLEHLKKRGVRDTCWFASYFPIGSELDLTTEADSTWLFPYSDADRTLRWFRASRPFENLPRNRYGIPEKKRDETFLYQPENPHLIVFVPALAATPSGYRLGYGGGFYDTFIERFQHQITTVVCLPDELIFDHLPLESHDAAVDLVVTEKRIFERPQLLCKLRT